MINFINYCDGLILIPRWPQLKHPVGRAVGQHWEATSPRLRDGHRLLPHRPVILLPELLPLIGGTLSQRLHVSIISEDKYAFRLIFLEIIRNTAVNQDVVLLN